MSAVTANYAAVPHDEDSTSPLIKVKYPRVKLGAAMANGLLIALGVVFLVPLLWMVLASVDAQANWAVKLPSLTGHQYLALMNLADLRPFYNSMCLAGVSTVVTTVTGLFAAYPLSRAHVPLKRSFMVCVLFASALPTTMLVLPTYQLYLQLGWTNSLFTTSLFLAASSLPFTIWLLKNFIDQVPRELEEAAELDGAGTFRRLIRVVVPLAFPGIAATAIIVFIGSWGAFLIPLVLDSNPNDVPGAIAIYQFLGGSYGIVKFGELAAYSLLFSIPVVLLYVLAGRKISGAFHLAGGVKG